MYKYANLISGEIRQYENVFMSSPWYLSVFNVVLDFNSSTDFVFQQASAILVHQWVLQHTVVIDQI